MSVVLFILKIIGIILLALLGIILFLLFLVLLVPVRYQVYGQIEDGITIHAKVTWLLHFVTFRADYEGEEFVSGLRIFGIRMRSKDKSAMEEEAWEEEEGATHENQTGAEQSDCVQTEEIDKAQEEDIRKEEDVSNHHHQSLKSFQKIQENGRKVFDGMRKIKIDEEDKTVLLAVSTELKYLFMHFKIRRLNADLQFSAGDPAATGQALGVLSMFPILYKFQVSVVPDFESDEVYVKGVFEIKGRVRVVHLVVSLVRLYGKKEVRVFAKKLLNR